MNFSINFSFHKRFTLEISILCLALCLFAASPCLAQSLPQQPIKQIEDPIDPKEKKCDGSWNPNTGWVPSCIVNGRGATCTKVSDCSKKEKGCEQASCVAGGSGSACFENKDCQTWACAGPEGQQACTAGADGTVCRPGEDCNRGLRCSIYSSYPNCVLGGYGEDCAISANCSSRVCREDPSTQVRSCVYDNESSSEQPCQSHADCRTNELRCVQANLCFPSEDGEGIPCSALGEDPACGKRYCSKSGGNYFCTASPEATTRIECTKNEDCKSLEEGKKCTWIPPTDRAAGYFTCEKNGNGEECNNAADCGDPKEKRCQFVPSRSGGSVQCIPGGEISNPKCTSSCPQKVCSNEGTCVKNQGQGGAPCADNNSCFHYGCEANPTGGGQICIKINSPGLNACWDAKGNPLCDVSAIGVGNEEAMQLLALNSRPVSNEEVGIKSLNIHDINPLKKISANVLSSFVSSLYGHGVTGPDSASDLVISFNDANCGMSGKLSREALPELYELAEAGKIKVIFVPYPLIPKAAEIKISEAFYCAAEQGKLVTYISAHYGQKKEIVPDDLSLIGKLAGLNSANFSMCLASGRYAARIQQNIKFGVKFGVRGTPSNFLLRNGRVYDLSGARPASHFQSVLEINKTPESSVSIERASEKSQQY
ncbi:DsbA family protein [bacterium]|nr:DsbA family protein [bacterium]